MILCFEGHQIKTILKTLKTENKLVEKVSYIMSIFLR